MFARRADRSQQAELVRDEDEEKGEDEEGRKPRVFAHRALSVFAHKSLPVKQSDALDEIRDGKIVSRARAFGKMMFE